MKRKQIVLIFLGVILAFGILIGRAPYPKLKLEELFFGYVLPPFQIGFITTPSTNITFDYEPPQVLDKLSRTYRLKELIAPGKTDFDRHVLLMHWVRDQFPHGTPLEEPDSQRFNGLEVLKNKKADEGFLCGTASQLLIQAITATGGYARRVELRFTPYNQHAVVEAWSEFFNKWVVLDPDYDIYYLKNNEPQNALELHETWVKNEVSLVNVVFRDSPHNIYQKEAEKLNPGLLRELYEEGRTEIWYKKIKKEDPDYYQRGKFSVKLLHFYSHLSYPLRNNWVSRPLGWWHPKGNHVQNSLTLNIPTMPHYDDFMLSTPNPGILYLKP